MKIVNKALTESKRLLEYFINFDNDFTDENIQSIKHYINALKAGCECDEYNGFNCGCSSRALLCDAALDELNYSSDIPKIISKLPHNKERVPYTYHHDYLRTHVNRFKDYSRSAVASLHYQTKEEMYVVALTQILNEINFSDTIVLTQEELELCYKAIATTDVIINRYNSEVID